MKTRARLAAEIGVAVAIGVAILFIVRGASSIGRDVSQSDIAQRIVADVMPSDDDDTVTILIFGDYRCPACRQANGALQTAARKHGKVRFVVREWPVFGPPSEELARIAIASRFQNLHPQFHDALMRAPTFDPVQIRAIFEELGGDWARLQSDLANRSTAIDTELAKVRREAFALGLVGTPAFLTSTTLAEGAMTQAEFGRFIEQSSQPPRSGRRVW
ncbi:MAG: thioredoxin domain-containing protein [Pontixanthobacter sp.]